MLLQLDAHKSIRPNGIHSRVLKELVDVIADFSPLFFKGLGSLEKSLSTEAHKCCPRFQEQEGNYKPVSPTSVPDKTIEKVILRVTEKCVE